MRLRLSHARSLSSTTSGRSMRLGEIVLGLKARYRLTHALHKVDNIPTILKADVLQGPGHSVPARCVIVKFAAPGNEASRDNLIREYKTYQVQGVSASRDIRAMYDIVGDPMELNDKRRNDYPGLVLEWFDSTLQDISPEQYTYDTFLLRAIMRAILSSSATLHSQNLVNTDIKPDNIFVSNVDKRNLIVKVGDLGSGQLWEQVLNHRANAAVVYKDGEAYECQPFAMRAPEVWRGLACTHRSEVWALAAMVLVWMRPGLLGSSGANGFITAPIWTIAKLMQLFPGWKVPPINKEFRQEEFEIAEMLTKELDPVRIGEKRIKVSSLDEEMEIMKMPLAWRDFLRVLLDPQSESRPSASEALASREYLALWEAPSIRRVKRR